jgi:hypothetical protein
MKEEKWPWPLIVVLIILGLAFLATMLEQGRPVPSNFGDSKEEFYGGWGGRDYTNGSNNEDLQEAHRLESARWDAEWQQKHK